MNFIYEGETRVSQVEVLAEKGTEPTHVSEEHTELEDRGRRRPRAIPTRTSTLVTITCQESIKLNMHLGSKTLSGLRICGMQFARFHKTCHVNIQFIFVAVLSTPRSVNLTKSM